MPDKLTQIYDDWKKTVTDPVDFQIFQAGFTAGAVAMRDRAVKTAQTEIDRNKIINKIGGLSDIPT